MESSKMSDKIATEVARINNSPYPISLAALHSILSLDQDGHALIEFEASNLCELKKLASRVIDGLECQQFEPDLVGKLCVSRVFHAHLLASKPELLHALLSNANQGNLKYRSLCVSLLRSPLPADVALPSSVEEFFVAIIKDAIRNPSPDTLATAYDLLSGACRTLPQILQQSDWTRLEEGLVTIVKNTRTIQDQSLSLLCLGLLELLAHDQKATRPQGRSDVSSFFIGSKSLKSLTLAVLQAVWTTKSARQFGHLEVIRSMDIVSRIVLAIPEDQLAHWSASSEGQAAIARLASQCQDSSMHVSVRIKLFSVVAQLCQSQRLPTQTRHEALGFLAQRSCLHVERHMFEPIECVISSLLISAPRETCRTLLQTALKALTSSNLTVQETQNIGLLFRIIRSAMANNKAIGEALVSELHDLDQDTLETILAPTNKVSSTNDRVCLAEFLHVRHVSRRELVFLRLAAEALASQLDSRETTVMKLCELLQEKDVRVVCRCGSSLKAQPSLVTIIEQQSSDAPRHGSSWRDSIRLFAVQQANLQEKNLASMVGGVCADLEMRCETAEAPFREAQQKVNTLEKQLAEAQGRNTELDQEVVDAADRMRSMVSESKKMQETLQSENDRLIERVQDLGARLKDSVESAKAQLERQQAESKAEELHLRTCITEKEMLLDDAHSEIDELRRQNDEVSSSLKGVREMATERDAHLRDLQASFDIKTVEIQALQGTVTSLRSDLADLTQMKTDADSKVEAISEELQLHRTEKAASDIAHSKELAAVAESRSQQEQLHAAAIEQAQQKFDHDTSRLAQKLDEHQASLEAEQCAREELRQRCTELSQALTKRDSELEHLQGVIVARDEEIAEFQNMRQTLAAALGHLPDKKHTRKSVHYDPAITQARRRSRRLTDRRTMSPLKGGEALLPTENLVPDANASFESVSTEEGSTPKRAKPHKPFKVPSLRPSRLATPRSVGGRTQRLPLADASSRANRSPSRQLLASTKKAMTQLVHEDLGQKAEYAALDELDFGSEVFTSTPFTPARPRIGEMIDDDETVDD